MKELLSIEDPIAGLLGAWSAGLNLGSALLRIALIVALAASIGCERSSKRHSAGLRTFVQPGPIRVPPAPPKAFSAKIPVFRKS